MNALGKKQEILLTNDQGYLIPHADMVRLAEKGVLRLGINNSSALQLASMGLAPTKSPVLAAYKFWSFVSFTALLAAIYFAFTWDWWWALGSFVGSLVIASANKKGNAENYVAAASTDPQFYEMVLGLRGWRYMVSLTDAEPTSHWESYRASRPAVS